MLVRDGGEKPVEEAGGKIARDVFRLQSKGLTVFLHPYRLPHGGLPHFAVVNEVNKPCHCLVFPHTFLQQVFALVPSTKTGISLATIG